MQPIQLFELASSQAHWLSVRQSVVAGNIANVNTPGYVAKDVEPFQSVLDSLGTQQSATQAAHFTGASTGNTLRANGDAPVVDIASTGSSPSLEQELMNAGETRRAYELNMGLVRSFHRMMLMTVRK